MSDFFSILLDWLKGKKYWKTLQPFLVLGFGYVATEVMAFELIQSEYDFKPSLRLFLGSYFFVRITLVFVGLAAVLALFQIHRRPGEASLPGRLRSFVQRHQSIIIFRVIGVLLVSAAVMVAFRHFGTTRVSTIRIKLLNEPAEFNSEAFAYLVYELNRQQKSWFYELDFEPFNEGKLTSTQREEADRRERRMFYYAELSTTNRPLIAITEGSLGKAFFCEHQTDISVISTFDRDYAPLSTYEYLSYCLVVQSMVIHLDVQGGGLPTGAFDPSSSSHGGVFQFNPRKELLKATILAARLSPDEEALLFNRFGPEYMNVCRRLLSLDWLRSERVVKNLATHFGVTNAVSGPIGDGVGQ
jgi:hypothetical protein